MLRKQCKCGTILETKAPQCKSCAREYMQIRRNKALENGASKQDVYNYTWRIKNPESYLYQTAKSRAKKSGLDFNLDITDIQIPKECPILGIPLFIRQGSKELGKNPNNPSLDRIDSSKGYIEGNVQWVTYQANLNKHVMTMEQLYEFCRKVLNHANQQPSQPLTKLEGSETN